MASLRPGFGGGLEGYFDAAVVNLSPTGACVEFRSGAELSPRDRITLRLRANSLDMFLPAQVVWASEFGYGQRVGIALQLQLARAASRTDYARWIVDTIQSGRHSDEP